MLGTTCVLLHQSKSPQTRTVNFGSGLIPCHWHLAKKVVCCLFVTGSDTAQADLEPLSSCLHP